jgi:hypothetical protein
LLIGELIVLVLRIVFKTVYQTQKSEARETKDSKQRENGKSVEKFIREVNKSTEKKQKRTYTPCMDSKGAGK